MIDFDSPPAMLVGLNGRARAGKDTAATWLVENHGFRRYALASPLRSALTALNPMMPGTHQPLADLVATHGWERLKNHPTIGPETRRMMIDLGAHLRATYGQDIMLAAFDRFVTATFGPHPVGARVVVSDVRLWREATHLRDQGARIVHIDRANLPVVSDDVTEQPLPSELFHASVDNDGDPDGLGHRVARALGLETEPAPYHRRARDLRVV